ncbi:MAG: transposase [Nitrosomonas sp.]|nr:transposase [Nitrosomonas sp.]
MHKTHYSCAELAAMKLPGLPATKRNMLEVVNREGWLGQKRTGRGGGFEYQPPAKIQKLIAEHGKIQSDGQEAKDLLGIRSQLRIEAEQSRAAKTQVAVSDIMASVTTNGQKKFDARFDIILAWRNYFQEKKYAGSIGRNESFKRFEEDYNGERVQVEAEVRAQYPLVSWRSVQRWVLDSEKEGVLTICDRRHVKGAKVKSQIEAHPELEKAVIAILTEKNHIQSSHLVDILNHARIDRDTGEILWPQISYSAVCRYRRKFEENNAQALLAETNPDAWKNKYLSSLGKLDGDVVRLNQRWEMDGTPADWEFIDGRYTASVVLDIFGRRPMIRFSKTPRTETNKQLTRAAIMKWGVPEQIKTDNGTDYVSREMRLCFEMLNIEHLRSAPFSPWEKGHVERFIKTYLHSVLEMLDNFIGHNVAERKQIEAKRTFAENLFKKNAVVKVDMTAEEMQRLTDAWIDGIYMVKKHSSLGVSPLEKVASWTGAIRQINSDRALDILLAKPGKKMPVITKSGIRYDNANFIHPLLPLPDYCGKRAEISLDPNDLGRLIVYVDGKFVCVAVCPERAGIDRQEIAAHGRALQKEAIAQKRKEFKAAKKALPMSIDDLVKDLLITRAEQAGKVEILQSRVEKHETERLIEAERAAKALAAPQVSPEHARILEEARQMAAKARNPNPTIIAHPAQAQTPLEGMTNEQKYELWLDFDATVKSGGNLTESWQQRFYDGYPKTSAYRAQAALRQEESLLARQR